MAKTSSLWQTAEVVDGFVHSLRFAPVLHCAAIAGRRVATLAHTEVMDRGASK
jgi:hypothetical protein